MKNIIFLLLCCILFMAGQCFIEPTEITDCLHYLYYEYIGNESGWIFTKITVKHQSDGQVDILKERIRKGVPFVFGTFSVVPKRYVKHIDYITPTKLIPREGSIDFSDIEILYDGLEAPPGITGLPRPDTYEILFAECLEKAAHTHTHGNL